MSRRKPPAQKWHIGDTCQVPIYLRHQASGKTTIQWADAHIVAIRGHNVIVRQHGWEHEYPHWEIREKPPARGNAITRILNRLGHNRHRRTL